MKTNADIEIWYVVELANRGADDWVADGPATYEHQNSARIVIRGNENAHPDYEYRIVRKTLISKVVE